MAVHVKVIVQWATAVWVGWPSLEVLDAALEVARRRLAEAPNPWAVASDAPSVFILTSARLKWTLKSARLILTDQGIAIDMLKVAPLTAAEFVKEATVEWNTSVAAVGEEPLQVDWQPIQTIAKARPGKGWTKWHNNVVTKTAAGGLYRQFGEAGARPKCICGLQYSLHHELYECYASWGQRQQTTSEELRKAASRIRGATAKEAFARGRVASPRYVSAPPLGSRDCEVLWINRPDGEVVTDERLLVFTDGSAKQIGG